MPVTVNPTKINAVELTGPKYQPTTIVLLTPYHLYSYLYTYTSAGFRPYQRCFFVWWMMVDTDTH